MPKRCKQCKTEIVNPTPWRKPFCSYQCGIHWTRAKEQEKKAKKQRKETREWKEVNKTKPTLTKEAQSVFNKYIRLRDTGKPCPSCGRNDNEITESYTGGKWDCGHYLSVGSHPELRFDESNAHRQCKTCNGGAGKYTRKNHTVSQEYRERLIQRIGLAEVQRLEGPHEMPNWTHQELRDIKQYYKSKIKGLKDESP